MYNDTQMAITIKAEYLPYFYELGLLSYVPYPISVIAPGCEVADDGSGAYIRNSDANVTEPVFTAELLEKTILDPETGYMSHPSVVSGPYKLVSFDGDLRTMKIKQNGGSNDDVATVIKVTLAKNGWTWTEVSVSSGSWTVKAVEKSSSNTTVYDFTITIEA